VGIVKISFARLLSPAPPKRNLGTEKPAGAGILQHPPGAGSADTRRFHLGRKQYSSRSRFFPFACSVLLPHVVEAAGKNRSRESMSGHSRERERDGMCNGHSLSVQEGFCKNAKNFATIPRGVLLTTGGLPLRRSVILSGPQPEQGRGRVHEGHEAAGPQPLKFNRGLLARRHRPPFVPYAATSADERG